MYEEPWFNAFAPREHSRLKHESSLKRNEPQNEGHDTDVPPIGDRLSCSLRDDAVISPPLATVARRSASCSALHDAVRAQVKKERESKKQRRRAEKRRLHTEAEISEEYSHIERSLQDYSDEEYQIYREQLRLAESHLDKLVANARSALGLLRSLSDSFEAVAAQTADFQSRCEDIVADQKRITRIADQIANNLQYYNYLEPATRRLNAPGASNFVRRQEFLEMLSNLDACLDYMQAHPQQKEASTYRSRYKLLLTRALTLLRNHFTNSLKDVSADVQKRIADKQLNDTTMSALLSAKFRVGAPELKRMGLEIQRRAVVPAGAEPGTEPEYQGLMNELYQSYSTARSRLLSPLVSKKMADIANAPSTSKDLVAFARTAITYVRGICFDEYDLWYEWFYSDGALYDFLEGLCEPFYDYLRPRTIRETQILKLCELCTLIQTRYMSDDEEDADSPLGPKLDFAVLIHPALEDAQTRLVFLAMTVLRNDIEYFKPQPSDLNYPANNSRVKAREPALSGRKTSNGPLSPLPKTPTVVEQDGGEPQFGLASANHDWYPTLKKAVWLLSRIYRLVHSTVFDDLAHQIVHQTTVSLTSASNEIAKRVSPTDAQLFLLKYLLILKQQIVAFDIEFVSKPEVSFTSSLTSTFYELRERGGLFNTTNLMRLVSGGLLVPRVVRNMLDAKAELDGQLRSVINEFTAAFASRMSEPISSAAITKAGPRFDPNDAAVAVRRAVEKDAAFLRKKLDEYLDDDRTRETLVGAVQDQVTELYETFYDTNVHSDRARKGGGIKGKGREDVVWTPEAFEEWAAGVFNVGRIGFQDDNDVASVGGQASDSE